MLNRKTLTISCLLGLFLGGGNVVAQGIDDDVTYTGESLRGINTQSIENNYDYQYSPKLDITIENQEKRSSTGNELLDLYVGQQKNNTNTIERINTNQGDTTDSQGGTIPFASF